MARSRPGIGGRGLRVVGAVAALVVLAGSFVLTLARLVGSEAEPWVLAAAFVPWAIGGYLVALVLLALLAWRAAAGRVRVALLVAIGACVLGLGLHTWWLAPSYVGERATGRPDLTVMTFNMLRGHADPAGTAALVRREDPDLVVLTEVTPQALAAAEARGIVGDGSTPSTPRRPGDRGCVRNGGGVAVPAVGGADAEDGALWLPGEGGGPGAVRDARRPCDASGDRHRGLAPGPRHDHPRVSRDLGAAPGRRGLQRHPRPSAAAHLARRRDERRRRARPTRAGSRPGPARNGCASGVSRPRSA